MRGWLAKTLRVLTRSVQKWSEDTISIKAAALAFFVLLAIAPLLVVLIAVAGALVNPKEVSEVILSNVNANLGTGGATLIQHLVIAATKNHVSFLQSSLALIVAAFGSSNILVQLEFAVNEIWKIPSSQTPFLKMLQSRSLAVATVFAVAGILAVYLFLESWLGIVASDSPFLVSLAIVGRALGPIFIFCLFWFIFKFLPSNRVTWLEALPAAILTSAVLAIARYGVALYLKYAALASVYGSAGTVVIVLLYLYYSSQIILFGYEVTFVLCHPALPSDLAGQDRA